MKTFLSSILSSVALAMGTAAFQTAAEIPATTTVSPVDPAKLPYGVADVLKLTNAKVGEEVIVTYIQTSGTAYNLNANEIVYLREQGVSDRVLNVMLEQRKRLIEAIAQAPPPAQQPQQQPYAQQPYAAPVDPYYQEAVATPASSVYVIPYPTTASYAYYGYYRPYYYPYYSSYYPYYSSYCRTLRRILRILVDTGQAFRSVSAMVTVITAIMGIMAIKAITDTVMAGTTAITVVITPPAFMLFAEVVGTTGTLAARRLLTAVLGPEVSRPCALVVHAREGSPL